MRAHTSYQQPQAGLTHSSQLHSNTFLYTSPSTSGAHSGPGAALDGKATAVVMHSG